MYKNVKVYIISPTNVQKRLKILSCSDICYLQNITLYGQFQTIFWQLVALMIKTISTNNLAMESTPNTIILQSIIFSMGHSSDFAFPVVL